MSEIARFFGIVIKMFFKPKEHDSSHLHAIYGECEERITDLFIGVLM
jgi:hypothetical protein